MFKIILGEGIYRIEKWVRFLKIDWVRGSNYGLCLKFLDYMGRIWGMNGI